MKIKNQLKTKGIIKYSFSLFVIILGLIFEYNSVGKGFLGFSSVGSWLIYIGFVMVVVITLQIFMNRNKIVDERMIFISNKAMRIVFIALVIFGFFIMVLDGINTITTPYHLFMAYLISFIMIIYFISYKILLRIY
jgi:hypothetical protein